MEEQTEFPIVMRGYDRVQVDLEIQKLVAALSDAAGQIETLDARNVTLSQQLADAQRQARETDRGSYTGVGARIEQLLRSAEEQSTTMINNANADAETLLEKTRTNTQRMTQRAEAEAASMLSEARREAEERTSRAASAGSGSIPRPQRSGTARMPCMSSHIL